MRFRICCCAISLNSVMRPRLMEVSVKMCSGVCTRRLVQTLRMSVVSCRRPGSAGAVPLSVSEASAEGTRLSMSEPSASLLGPASADACVA